MSTIPEPLTRVLDGRYRVEREIGRGGMATVWLAEDLRHGRRVAIKVLSDQAAAALGAERFLREIEIAARLVHPHILPLFDSGVAGGRIYYYVTPHIEGETLRARLTREKQLPLDEALRLAREIASALGHAHQHGVVHRDIKPENVLLADGLALVADFGIALVSDDANDAALTATGIVLGTAAYMAPEQLMGRGDVDARADLYALGCVLHEMLAGAPPFVGPAASLAHQHLGVAPRPVSEVRADIPAGVASAILRALSKTPADRFANAARFAEALVAGAAGGADAPPAAAATPNNLPRQRTQFIGRERALAECCDLLERSHLLTLIGIGGSGKTRLAQELAAGRLALHPDGVWFIDLAPLTEDAHVAQAVAAALGVQEVAGRALADVLGDALAGRQVLLVLDNCEHLLTACAALVDTLLRRAGALSVLATSREGLGIAGEQLVPVQPLAVPPADAPPDPEAAQSAEAVRLFVDRAQLVLGAFTLTADNVTAVVEICRRLDGVPLAIELAAARVRVLSVEQIRVRLDDRFRLLTGGSRTALPRHRTLAATLQWSYDLLSPEEQGLFRRLSVFAGGWTLDLATRAVGGDEFAVLDLHARLVDKSLVLVVRSPGADPRYGMLETVRQYALERLVEAGESADARQRHFDALLASAEQAYPERFEREEAWSAAFETDHDNLRAAVEFVRGEDHERYLQIVGALAWFWQVRSHFLEARGHLEAALAAAPPAPARPARARALWGMANIMVWQGDPMAARRCMEESLAMWRELADQSEVALALEGIGWAQLLNGEDEDSLATFEECLALQRTIGSPALVLRLEVAVTQVLVALHRVHEGRALAEKIVAASAARGDRRNEHFGWHFLADCALIAGECEDSLALYRKALGLAHVIGDRLETSFEVQGVAMSLAGLGDNARAVRLAGAVQGEWDRLGADPHMRFWDELLERNIGGARRALGAAETERVWHQGSGTPFERAIELALDQGG